MSIAGQVVQELEFAKDREVSADIESVLEFRQGRDFAEQQVRADGLGIEGEWPIMLGFLLFESLKSEHAHAPKLAQSGRDRNRDLLSAMSR
jgi:hypothetical protein